MSNITKWGSYDQEQMKKDQRAAEAATASAYFKPRQGNNRLRFLPPGPGTNSIFASVMQHYLDDASEEKSKSFNCPRKTIDPETGRPMGMQCAACSYAEALKASGSSADYAFARNFSCSLRTYCNVIDVDNEDDGVQVYAFGPTIMSSLTAIIDAGKKFWGNPKNPLVGTEIIVNKVGEKMKTKYKVFPGDEHVIDPSMEDSVIGGMHKLEQFTGVPTSEDVRNFMRELGYDPDETPEAPAPKARTPRPRQGAPAPAAKQAAKPKQQAIKAKDAVFEEDDEGNDDFVDTDD